MIKVIKMINNLQHFSYLMEEINSKVEVQQEAFLVSLWDFKLEFKYRLSTELCALR